MTRTLFRCLAVMVLPATLAGTEISEEDDHMRAALSEGDECVSKGCSLNALQLRHKASLAVEETYELSADAKAWQAELMEKYNISVPTMATQYDGIAWPPMSLVEAEGASAHIFAIGDWGGLLPSHFTAPNHRGEGHDCPQDCGYVNGIDDKAQLLVAAQVKARAGKNSPQYFLNVGDNFYFGGVHQTCGWMGASWQTVQEFQGFWKDVYGSLTNVPWLSVLGNHDYGGWQFNSGWDAQIGYSFVDKNWVMPARYFSRVMQHPGFSMEYFMIDSNSFDAHNMDWQPKKNICGPHNPPGANCAATGGPASVSECKDWFWNSYHEQQRWLQKQLAASTADWQVVVTHFPCEHDASFYARLHQEFGLDLLVTGHRHQQELFANSGLLGGMTCFVTGGGGGITSEQPPIGQDTNQYGFFDLTVSKDKIYIESVNLNGRVINSATVTPVGKKNR